MNDGRLTFVILGRVADERRRQNRLIAEGVIPWDCANPDVGDAPKLAVLGEEFGEVARAVVEGLSGPEEASGLQEELLQVAAVATAWAEALEPPEEIT